MAHHRPDLLRELLFALDDSRNDVFLHIDAKAEELHWELQMQNARLTRIPGMSVNWGGYTQVECEYRLLKAALEAGPHDYYHLLTGVTYPLQSQDKIDAYLQQHQGTEYVGFDNKRDYSFRVKYRHLFCEEGKIPGIRGKIKRRLREYYLRLQKMAGVDHFKKYHMVCKKGCAYWSITQEFAEYVAAHEEMVRDMLRYSISGDEVFVQTLLYNSKFRSRAKSLTDEYDGCMRELAWEHITQTNDPWHNFHLQDLDYLLKSERWFALKFESEDGPALIAALKRKLEE